jgi:hypothetical protein
MAAYFSLTRVGEDKPTPFVRVDEELCRYMGELVDPVQYYRPGGTYSNWFDTVGLGIACGKTGAELIAWAPDHPEWVAMVQFLQSNYEWDCWSMR